MGQWLAKLSLQELGPSYVDTFFSLFLLVSSELVMQGKTHENNTSFCMTRLHQILSKSLPTDLTFSLITCTTTAFNS
jgi:hypothetical protein